MDLKTAVVMQWEDRPLRVWEIGEQGLLKRLQSFCPTELVGDDAAVLTVQSQRSLIVTSDVLVDGVHFSDRTTTPEDAGWRAAAANLSDLAAMGAMPLGITVGLGVPAEVEVDWIERLYQGITDCLQQYNTVIVGGDVCRSPVMTIAITAFGEADPTRIIRRSTAQPGDVLLMTGFHGASRAGLELLLHPEQGGALGPDDRAALIQAHQRPKPRLDVVPLLWRAQGSGQRLETGNDRETRREAVAEKLAERFSSQFTSQQIPGRIQNALPAYSIAGMDSSDGLADAIVQICRASGVGARVERHQIPLPSALTGWVGTEQALHWALYGGEDFELVLCLPPQEAEDLLQQLQAGAAIVGRITSDPEIWLVDQSNNYPAQQLILEQGFQHFANH
ncbi:MAG: thiamine-phosphate kinase [Kovacikia sp.]